MTATDQAFIRVFDSQAAPRESAPHVSFAARGVQVAAGFDPVIVWGGVPTAETARDDAAEEASPMVAQAPAATVATATAATGLHRAPSPAPEHSRGAETYLPSSYRNLVEVGGPPDPSQQHQRLHRRQDPPAGESRRRPLAELLHDEPRVPEFRPALEVDALHWPHIVGLLLEQAGAELDKVGDALVLAGQRGEQVTVFHSTQRGAGCTTLTLAMARLLARRGRSVAVVDADFLRPQLAGVVGLSLAQGWETTLHFGTALAESVIRSLEDGLSIVPLAAPLDRDRVSGELSGDGLGRHVASAVQELAAHYDLVLVDGGCPAASAEWEGALRTAFAAAADACVLVSATGTMGIGEGRFDVDERPAVLGVIENCAAGP